MPKKLKHRKQNKGKMPTTSSRGYKLDFGKYGLKAETGGLVTARQIEAARRAATRCIKRGGQVWIRIFPDKPKTAKAAETGMGGGKGSLDHFVAMVSKGKILFEMDGVTGDIAKEALRLAAFKLPVKTRFIQKG